MCTGNLEDNLYIYLKYLILVQFIIKMFVYYNINFVIYT